MRKVLAFLCIAMFLLFSSCGHPTQLTSMSISPSGVTFSNAVPGMTHQLTAYGVFIHPKETRDITTDVTWTSSAPDIATVDQNGLVTTVIHACGQTVITATADSHLVGAGGSGSIMTATAMIDVQVTGWDCP